MDGWAAVSESCLAPDSVANLPPHRSAAGRSVLGLLPSESRLESLRRVHSTKGCSLDPPLAGGGRFDRHSVGRDVRSRESREAAPCLHRHRIRHGGTHFTENHGDGGAQAQKEASGMKLRTRKQRAAGESRNSQGMARTPASFLEGARSGDEQSPARPKRESTRGGESARAS